MTTRLPSGTGHAPVDGGELAYEVLPGSTPPVLAIHGISSQRKLWNWLHHVSPELTLIAPDLRGRADSVELTGPSSLGRHVADLIALLDHSRSTGSMSAGCRWAASSGWTLPTPIPIGSTASPSSTVASRWPTRPG